MFLTACTTTMLRSNEGMIWTCDETLGSVRLLRLHEADPQGRRGRGRGQVVNDKGRYHRLTLIHRPYCIARVGFDPDTLFLAYIQFLKLDYRCPLQIESQKEVMDCWLYPCSFLIVVSDKRAGRLS